MALTMEYVSSIILDAMVRKLEKSSYTETEGGGQTRKLCGVLSVTLEMGKEAVGRVGST